MKPAQGLDPTANGPPDFLQGGGEMARVIATKDWSKTPLGSFESWPQSLRTAISICLASNFPISMAWGEVARKFTTMAIGPSVPPSIPDSMGQDFRDAGRPLGLP